MTGKGIKLEECGKRVVLLKFCSGKSVPDENESLPAKTEMRNLKTIRIAFRGKLTAYRVEDCRLDEFLAYVSTVQCVGVTEHFGLFPVEES